jgi:hypothetical protein
VRHVYISYNDTNRMRLAWVALFVSVFSPNLVPAAELELRFGALERIIGQQVFTQEGRLYVRGSASTKCKFAFIEKPHVGGENGFLRVTGRFSGRTAIDVLGRCVGLGDSFDFTMLATPVVRDGALGLTDVNINTPRDSFYIRKVREAMVQSIARGFRVDVQSQANRLLDQAPGTPEPPGASPPGTALPGTAPPGTPPQDVALFQRELTSFQLRNVRATADGIVLDVDFHLIVK